MFTLYRKAFRADTNSCPEWAGAAGEKKEASESEPARELLIKTESTRKLSNFNFQWTKTLYQNSLKNIAFFFFNIFQGL